MPESSNTTPVAVQQLPEHLKEAAKTEEPKAVKAQRRKAKRIQTAKAKVAAHKAVPPAKAAEKLARSAFPELADENWVRGNPDAAKKLRP